MKNTTVDRGQAQSGIPGTREVTKAAGPPLVGMARPDPVSPATRGRPFVQQVSSALASGYLRNALPDLLLILAVTGALGALTVVFMAR